MTHILHLLNAPGAYLKLFTEDSPWSPLALQPQWVLILVLHLLFIKTYDSNLGLRWRITECYFDVLCHTRAVVLKPSSTWELVRNAIFQVASEIYWVRNSGGEVQKSMVSQACHVIQIKHTSLISLILSPTAFLGTIPSVSMTKAWI